MIFSAISFSSYNTRLTFNQYISEIGIFFKYIIVLFRPEFYNYEIPAIDFMHAIRDLGLFNFIMLFNFDIIELEMIKLKCFLIPLLQFHKLIAGLYSAVRRIMSIGNYPK